MHTRMLVFSEKRYLVVTSTWYVFTGDSCESEEGGGGWKVVRTFSTLLATPLQGSMTVTR